MQWRLGKLSRVFSKQPSATDDRGKFTKILHRKLIHILKLMVELNSDFESEKKFSQPINFYPPDPHCGNVGILMVYP